jgi:ubiquinone/menaquinone biosynthesis C-methylase UbiE
MSNQGDAPSFTVPSVPRHYGRGGLLQRLEQALRDDGADPAHPSADDLAPYDQLHGRGIEATEELAAMLDVSQEDHLLDIGSGIGGPARALTRRFGCRVTGIDLTEELCAVAEHFTRALALAGRVRFQVGDALAMPFAAGTFDGAYSMNVSMNIADKDTLYAEVARVLKPSGWFALSEVAQGTGAPPDYPAPWAATASESFLATPQEMLRALDRAGFELVHWRDTAPEAIAFAARSLAAHGRGEKPLQRAVPLLHGELGAQAVRNAAHGIAEGRIVPVEIFCRLRRA